MKILDTSAIIEWMKGSERSASIREICKGDSAVISAVRKYEFLMGYDELGTFEIIPFGPKEVTVSANLNKMLRKKGQQLSKMDTLIAGTALANNAELVTLDKAFTKVPGLNVTVI